MHPTDSAQPPASPVDPAWAIEGPLVIATVADWHARLRARLDAGPLAILDLAAVSTLDVFGLQLLLAACRHAAAAGRPLTLRNRPAAFDELCRSAGFAPSLFAHENNPHRR